MGQSPDPPPRRKRWGLRTLGFLTVALASLITANVLTAGGGQGNALTGLGVLVGFAGAAYCSYRGLRDFRWLQR